MKNKKQSPPSKEEVKKEDAQRPEHLHKKEKKGYLMLKKLCEHFPKAFNLKTRQPLKIGIHQDILISERLKDDTEITKTSLRKTINYYVRSNRYLKAIMKKKHRVDLDGNEVAVVDEKAKKHAHDLITQRKAFLQEKKQDETEQKPEASV